ncbi:unnamed protein product [Microthlaspi erraticum]|uniref:Uncharacterized protein n=1 Tax=Microthlaspi erraticum TaxID=1685480 RepID=A0A6D2I7I8_9BRAS|nr:unnamed protein product [Microthlaspi erraticum]CAA7021172.1 unnamed protein product [Microthlaspi erraticum]CAA7034083.1 unnamed protein product [Microthlaspi erraticum]
METKIPKSMIVGVLSVVPVKVTQHRKVRCISVGDPVGAGVYRRTLNIVTYYKQEGESGGERGWLFAGHFKESLGKALAEQPMLAGRLRRREDGLEVVPNDSGVRLVEARFPASLPEFLEMSKRDKSRAEAESVFWIDIDEVDPRFSPLCYVQVTNFESGGYSIGISCSILVADFIVGTDFLNKWAQIQSSLAHSQTRLKPIFHVPSVKQNLDIFVTDLTRSASVLDRGISVVYQAKPCLKMSLACMKKAIVTCEKASVYVFLYIKEHGENSTECDGVKVEVRSRDEAISDCDCNDLEETGVGVLNASLAFEERSEGTSCWVGSVPKGLVFFLVPPTFEGNKSLVKFMFALPKE